MDDRELAFVGLLVALVAPVVLVLANLPAIIAALAGIWAWIWS